MGNEFIFSDIFLQREFLWSTLKDKDRKTKILEDPFLQKKNISDREHPLYFHVHFSLVGS